ncbi:MAG TPA: hypothetical protein IAC72_03625, partial [Candidatus Fimimonas merdipullorum]|nr:hypothetical protein [Candidatus Fimimonas merdipullorum]
GGSREEKYKKYYDANINQQRYHKEIHENALRRYRRKWKICACLAAFFAILTAAFSYCYVAVAPQFLWGIIGSGFLFLLCLFLIWLNKNSEYLNISFIESFEKSIKEAESDIANKTGRLAAVNADVAECAALTRAAAKHTPRNGNKNNANQTERRGDAAPERSPFVGTCAAKSFFKRY